MAYRRNTSLTRIKLVTLARLRRLSTRFHEDMTDLLDLAVALLEKELRINPILVQPDLMKSCEFKIVDNRLECHCDTKETRDLLAAILDKEVIVRVKPKVEPEIK